MVSTSEGIPHFPGALHKVFILDLFKPSLGQITAHFALSTLLSGCVIFDGIFLYELFHGSIFYGIIAKLRLRLIVIVVI